MRSRTVAARPAAEADTGEEVADTGGTLVPWLWFGASRQMYKARAASPPSPPRRKAL